MAKVTLTPLKIIDHEKGNVMHALKNTDSGFSAFGEAYFSAVNNGVVKGWKRHNQMLMNLIVPVGEIRIVAIDNSGLEPDIFDVVLNASTNYQRLTIEPGVWFAFQGLANEPNLLLNIASIKHDPLEADNLPLSEFPQIIW